MRRRRHPRLTSRCRRLNDAGPMAPELSFHQVGSPIQHSETQVPEQSPNLRITTSVGFIERNLSG